jgi:hypothetical protein
MNTQEGRRTVVLWQPWLALIMACGGPLPREGFDVAGVLRRYDIEGGVFVIEVGDTGRYQPLDLPAEFRRDGLRIRATLRVATDAMTIGQVGKPVTVVEIVADTTG